MSSVSQSQMSDASRVALARLALDVVTTMPGVAGTDAGPGGLCVTADLPFGVLQGVSVIAQSDGRYEVDLCLVAWMVPLPSLGDEIRHRLRTRALRAGLAGQLGTVNVEFVQALGPGETLREVPGPEAAVGVEAAKALAESPSSPPPDQVGSPIPSSPLGCTPAWPPSDREPGS